MELISLLEGDSDSLRGKNGLPSDGARYNSVLTGKRTEGGVCLTIEHMHTKTITEEAAPADKKKGAKKGKKEETPKPAPKIVTVKTARSFTLSKWEALAIAEAVRSSIQFIIFG